MTMQDYSCYCTEEQARRAKKLGAPISTRPWHWSELVYDVVAGKKCHLIPPTTQQMIGWLRKEMNIRLLPVEVDQTKTKFCIMDENNDLIYTTKALIDYGQSELFAIDVALDYLEKK